MRFSRLFASFILVLLCGIAAISSGPVDAHDRGDFLPNLPTWAQQRVIQRGYGLYKMDARTQTWPGGSYPSDVANTIYRCMESEWKATGVAWYDESTDPNADVDLIFYMPDSYPNDGSVGVSYYTNAPAYINVNFRSGVVVWDSTYCHEFGHTNGQEDLYQHPLTCDASAKYTVMSCGTYIGTYQPYDIDIQRNVYLPDLPSKGWVYNDSTYVWVNWNGIRASSVGCSLFAGAAQHYAATEKDNYCGHYGPYLDNVTRVAIFYRDADAGWVFSGFYGDPAPTNGTAYRGFARSYWCKPNREWAVHPENAIPSTWYGESFSIPFITGQLENVGSC